MGQTYNGPRKGISFIYSLSPRVRHFELCPSLTHYDLLTR